MNEEEIRRFTEELRLSSDELKEFQESLQVLRPTIYNVFEPLMGKFSDATLKAARTTEEKTKTEKESTETQKRNTAATAQNTAITEALSDSFTELKNATNLVKTVLGNAAQVGIEFADALLKNEDGLSKYGSAVDSAGDAALEIGSKFGILGTILGGLFKVATAVIAAQMKQADMQVKAVQDISKLGGAGSYTTQEILKLSHSAGYTIENFEKLLKPIKSLGTSIQSLGSGADQGQREFIKLADVGSKTRMAFFRLGISQEELTQNQADYITLQKTSARLITQEMRDSGELRKASLAYTLQLQELSNLTGMSVEESKKSLNQVTNTIQMAAINAERGLKLLDLQKRSKEATGEELVQIEKTISLLKAQAIGLENANEAMAALGGGKEAGAAMQQFLDSGSASEELTRKFGMLGMDLNKVYTQFQETGKFDIPSFIDEYKQKMAEKMPQMLEGIKMAGGDAEAYGKSIGMSKDEIEFVIANLGKDTAQIIAENKKNRDAAFAKTNDAMMENLNQEKENRIANQIEKEKLLDATSIFNKQIMPDLTNAGKELTNLLKTVSDAMAGLMSVAALGGLVIAVKKATSVFGSAITLIGNLVSKTAAGPPRDALGRFTKRDKGLKGLTGALKGLGKAARFMPGIGQALSVGTALYGAYEGASNAQETLGVAPGTEITGMQKIGAGAAGALSALSLGIIDKETIGSKLYELMGGVRESTTPEKEPSGTDNKLLDFIGKLESNNNYNILVGGKTQSDPPLTDMTVAEVLAFQKTMLAKGHESTAVGKYQIINQTLTELVQNRVVKPEDKFDSTTQDKAAVALLKRRGSDDYRNGKIDLTTYANNLAMEWASLPMPDGRSYHAGVGSNKAGATRDDFIQAIQAKMGGLVKGPESGYPATLHGNEIIVPLNPNSMLVELGQKSKQEVTTEIAAKPVDINPIDYNGIQQMLTLNQNLMEMLTSKLDSVISKLDTGNDTQLRLLRYSQA